VNWSGATDNRALSGYRFVWSDVPNTVVSTNNTFVNNTNGSGSDTYTLSSDGVWYFNIRYYDAAGNPASDTLNYGPFWIDATAPSTPSNLTNPGSSDTSDDPTPNVMWSSSDQTSGIQYYQVDFYGPSGAHETLYSYNNAILEDSEFSGSELAIGNWSWTVTAVDNAGNVAGPSSGKDIAIADANVGNAELSAFIVPEGPHDRNTNIDIAVTVENTGDVTRSFWIGLSFSGPESGAWPDGWYDVPPIETRVLAPDETQNVVFSTTLPYWLPEGNYQAVTAAWSAYDAQNDLMAGVRYHTLTRDSFVLGAPSQSDYEGYVLQSPIRIDDFGPDNSVSYTHELWTGQNGIDVSIVRDFGSAGDPLRDGADARITMTLDSRNSSAVSSILGVDGSQVIVIAPSNATIDPIFVTLDGQRTVLQDYLNLGWTAVGTVMDCAAVVGASATAGASFVVDFAIHKLADQAMLGLANWAATEITDTFSPSVPPELEASDQTMWIFDFERSGLDDVSSFDALELTFDVGFDGSPGPVQIITDTRFAYSMTGAGFAPITGGTVADNGYVGEVRRSHTITPVALGISQEPEINIVLDGSSATVHVFDFSTVAVGDSESAVFRVHNSGSENLTVSQVSGLTNPFTIAPANGSGSSDDWVLLPGTSRTFTAMFSPSSDGVFDDVMILYSDDPDETTYNITLTGTGVAVVHGDQFEDDDSPSRATLIVTDGTSQEHSIHIGSDVDWVKFTLAEKSSVTIETDGPSGDTRMWLYGPNNWSNEIEYDDDGGASLWSRIVRSGGDALDPGTYYVKIDEYGNDEVIDSYTISVTAAEAVAPTASLSANAGAAQRSMLTSFVADFSEDVSASVSVGDLVVRNVLTDEPIAVADMAVAYDATHDKATWTFPGLPGGSLPDGNWEVTLLAGGIADAAGNPLDGNGDGAGGDDHVFNLFRFFGDADGDRDVDFADLFKFRGTYQKGSADPAFNATFDADSDGDVDFADLFKFRGNYQNTLEVPFDLVVSEDTLTVPEGGTAEFTVALSAQPHGTVTVTTTRTSGDEDLSVASGGTLTFDSSNWDIPHAATIAAAEDADSTDGTAEFTLTADGATNQPIVTVTEDDNDVATIAENVALAVNGAVATADSYGSYMGYVGLPERAIDGDSANGWCGLNGTSGWLQVEFDKISTISKIGIWWGSHQHDFSVSLSVNGTDWDTAVPMRQSVNYEGSPPMYESFDIAPTQAKFIRVDIHSTSAPGSHIYQAIIHEVEAWTDSRILASVDLPQAPRWYSIGVSPSGGTLFVTTSVADDPTGGMIYALDSATLQIVGTIATGYDPIRVAISPDGTVGYATNTVNGYKATKFDAVNMAVIGDVSTGTDSAGVVFTPDGTKVYTTNHWSSMLSIIDVATNTNVGSVTGIDSGGYDLAITPDGQFIYALGRTENIYKVSTSSNTVVHTITRNFAGGGGYRIAMLPNGQQFVVSGGPTNSVHVFDISTDSEVNVVGVGSLTAGIAVTGDGQYIAVALPESNQVKILDMASLAELATIDIAGYPIGVAFSTDNQKLYVTSKENRKLTVIGLNGVGGILLAENFESTATGSWPEDWTADANAVSNPSNNQVVDDPDSGTSKVLKLFGAIGSSWGALAYKPCNFGMEFSLRLRVYNSAEDLSGAHPDRAWLGMRQGTSWINPGRTLLGFKGDGSLIATDGTTLGSYSTEQWYDVRIDSSLSGSDLSLHYWVDDQDLGSVQVTVADVATENSLDHLDLTAQEGSAFFDDILVLPL